MIEKDLKSCFSIKNLISTSERHAEHPFAGQNTQQPLQYWNYYNVEFDSINTLQVTAL